MAKSDTQVCNKCTCKVFAVTNNYMSFCIHIKEWALAHLHSKWVVVNGYMVTCWWAGGSSKALQTCPDSFKML